MIWILIWWMVWFALYLQWHYKSGAKSWDENWPLWFKCFTLFWIFVFSGFVPLILIIWIAIKVIRRR